MVHHDPAHPDTQLEDMLAEAQTATGHDDLSLGHEGLEIELG